SSLTSSYRAAKLVAKTTGRLASWVRNDGQRDYLPSQLRRERCMAATLYQDTLDVAGSDSAKRIGHRHAALLVPGQRYVHSERQRIDFNNRLPGLRFW